MKTKCGKNVRMLLAAALAVMILLTGCASKSRKAAQRLELGQKYLTEMNYTEAVAAFTQVISLYPDNIQAYMGRAEAYTGLGQYEDAKTDYTAVIEKAEKADQPYTEVQAYMGRANASELLQENSSALSDYEYAKSLLEKIDWSRFQDVTEKIIRDLLNRIEEACRRLRELLGMEEENGGDGTETADIFQSAMDRLSVDSMYADSRRYVIPADYDGDGRTEAFGFFGRSNASEYGIFADLQVYFINAEGQTEKVSEIYGLDGAPFGMESEDQTDFSDCLMTVNGHTYAVFNVAPQQPGEGFAEVLGVRNGKYTVMEMGGYPDVLDNGLVEAPDLGFSVIYEEKDGLFRQVGTIEPDEDNPETSGQEPSAESGSVDLRQVWEKTKQNMVGRNGWSDYFLPADYDGDGRQEAFAVYGNFEDGYANEFSIYFITADGLAIIQNPDGLWSGRVFGFRNYDGTADSVLVKAGNRRIFVWEMPGAGNMPTIFFGVRNGTPYCLDLSLQYAWFIEDEGHYYVNDGEENMDQEVVYNAATGQFELNGNVRYY